jgi:hypothetical protein
MTFIGRVIFKDTRSADRITVSGYVEIGGLGVRGPLVARWYISLDSPSLDTLSYLHTQNSGLPYGKFEVLADVWVQTHYIAVLNRFFFFTNVIM